MRSRRGVSLVELLIVLSATTAVIGLSGKLMHQMMHAQSRANAMQQGERSALRLSAQFRGDVHRAREASVAGEAGNMAVTLLGSDAGEIQYRLEGEAVVRTVADDEKGQTAREVYRFPGAVELSFEPLEGPPRLRLRLEPPTLVVRTGGAQPVAPSYRVPCYLTVEACLQRMRNLDAVPAPEVSP